MLDFSALAGDLPPSTQTTLMQRYLEFFGLNLSGPYPYFHAATTSACLGQPVIFTDDSFDNIISRSWEFQGGTPATSSEINPSVMYDSPGNFDVQLTVSDGVHTKTMLKQKYIRADHCSGSEEHYAASALFTVFPNPATEIITIEFERNISGSCKIMVFDLTGNTQMERSQAIPAGNRVLLNLSGLNKGLYFMKIQAGELNSTLKVIRN
jgi:hypothetical protein